MKTTEALLPTVLHYNISNSWAAAIVFQLPVTAEFSLAIFISYKKSTDTRKDSEPCLHMVSGRATDTHCTAVH